MQRYIFLHSREVPQKSFWKYVWTIDGVLHLITTWRNNADVLRWHLFLISFSWLSHPWYTYLWIYRQWPQVSISWIWRIKGHIKKTERKSLEGETPPCPQILGTQKRKVAKEAVLMEQAAKGIADNRYIRLAFGTCPFSVNGRQSNLLTWQPCLYCCFSSLVLASR